MACHHSTEEEPYACKGYLAVEGWKNINVRALLAKKEIPHPDKVWAACEAAGIELHKDWKSALAKLSASRKRKR